MAEFERQSDVVDQAQAINEAHQERSLAIARAKSKPEQERQADGTWEHYECVSCGEEIPEGRLELGKIRCIYCQEALERKQRGL